MSNLDLYDMVRSVPKEAQKDIIAGRLKGMTDINPMWRIKTLTEQFGVCGIGWYTDITREWLEQGANGETTAHVDIKLFIRQGDEWSKGITGVGGSKYVSSEKNGYYTDDECFKKAYTDAISVACKALGIGADVYWSKDKTKYDTYDENSVLRQKNDNIDKPFEVEENLCETAKSTPEMVNVGNIVKKYGCSNEKAEEWVRYFEKKLNKTTEQLSYDERIACWSKLDQAKAKAEKK